MSLLEKENRNEAAKQIVAKNAPAESFHDLLPKTLSEELKTKILSEAKKVAEIANLKAVEEFNKDIEGYKPKRGRVPGSDVVMQNLETLVLLRIFLIHSSWQR